MLLFFYLVFILYEEVIYKLFTTQTFYSFTISSFFYYLTIASLLTLITSVIPKKFFKHTIRILTFIFSFWYGTALLVKRIFGITISLSATTLADQFLTGGFLKNAFIFIGQSWYIIILILVPFVISIFLSKYYKISNKKKTIIISSILMIVSFLLFISSLFIFKSSKEEKDLYFNKKNNVQNVEHFGVMPSLLIDIRKGITGFEEKIIIEEKPQEEKVEDKEEERVEEIKYDKQILNFDFEALAQNEENSSIKQLHEFFSGESPTEKNEFTGIFKDKNLIYIMAESFDGFAVSKELTPTLYKMIHSGFYFSNYYSPTNLSTIGGEFSELTGLIPDLTCLSWKWRESQGYGNYYPYGIANLYKNLGYKTYAYHNHDWDFQDRYVYLKAQGFDNYLGCGNGIENKGVACSFYGFPESDDEMILGTYNDYIHDDKFMVYYATVSGHMNWEFEENKMSKKHQEEVKELNYSIPVKAYIAATLELEQAMSDLLKALEDNDRLNDTVIVLAADHHPYGLSEDEMNELAGKRLDQTFELYRNNLIIYNPEVKYQKIDKVCSTIDVLPTTLNLFGIDYDSRLIIGKDILSNSDGVVIFAEGSWLTNKGRYNKETQNYDSSSNETNLEEYITKMDTLVSNRVLVSRNIMYYDYYRKLFNK